MNRQNFLYHPALWPLLAIDPAPFQNSADPESIERLYSEFYGLDSQRDLMPCQSTESTKAIVHADITSKSPFRPASGMHPLSARR